MSVGKKTVSDYELHPEGLGRKSKKGCGNGNMIIYPE